MAHSKSKEVAYNSFVIEKKTQKESARLAGVTPKTMSGWVEKYKWKVRRDALLRSKETGLENLSQLITQYTNKLLELERDPEADPKEKFNLTNQIAALSKTKNDFEKSHKIPFDVYVSISDKIMSALVVSMPNSKNEILDFFEKHISELATNY